MSMKTLEVLFWSLWITMCVHKLFTGFWFPDIPWSIRRPLIRFRKALRYHLSLKTFIVHRRGIVVGVIVERHKNHVEVLRRIKRKDGSISYTIFATSSSNVCYTWQDAVNQLVTNHCKEMDDYNKFIHANFVKKPGDWVLPERREVTE